MRSNGSEEELGSVGVRTRIGHGENAWANVSLLEVFILELATVDRLATSAVKVGEVATLNLKQRSRMSNGKQHQNAP